MLGKSTGPNKCELPFTAKTRDAALAWQSQGKKAALRVSCRPNASPFVGRAAIGFPDGIVRRPRRLYMLYHASFRCNDGQRRKCLWAVPKGPGPFPGMLCLHGHGGSAELVFNGKTIYRGFAERFARGGYCVLAPSFPHRTYAASTLWDLIRCVDILSAQKEVDRKRMGVMGLSMGGEWTMWVAACDTRLRAAVVSGWMCTTEGVFAVPNCPCWQLPGFVNLMDVCEVHLLIAARPVLFESAEGDPCFPIRYTREGFARIRAGYRVFGAEGACTGRISRRARGAWKRGLSVYRQDSRRPGAVVEKTLDKRPRQMKDKGNAVRCNWQSVLLLTLFFPVA